MILQRDRKKREGGELRRCKTPEAKTKLIMEENEDFINSSAMSQVGEQDIPKELDEMNYQELL